MMRWFNDNTEAMNRLPLILTILACISSCAGWKKPAANDKEGKLEYAPQENKVETIVLERKTFHSQLVSNGKLSAFAKSKLVFQTPGPIVKVNVRNGSYVGKGGLIAMTDTSAAAMKVASARIALDKARLDLADVLVGQGYSQDGQVPDNIMKMARMRSGFDNAENALSQAEHELAGTKLTAPFSGKVADVNFKVYDQSGTEPFCMLIDDHIMEVNFAVLESEFASLTRGLRVRIEPFSEGGCPLYGQISTINPSVDKNGQITVTATVRNDGTLLDGMNVRVIVERDVEKCLVVPRSAVVIRDDQNVLFRYVDGKALWTYVNILKSNGDAFAVEANTERGADLSEGDVVIVSGNLNLADGSVVSVIN